MSQSPMVQKTPPPVRISFCTACMGRLEHLRETLPANLADAEGHGAAEVVLLDYNSRDGLEEWVREHLDEPLRRGLLRYAKTTEPRAFHLSHARNLVFRLARGEVLVNVDADNFTGPGFARYVEERFAEGDDVFLTPDYERFRDLHDAYGRIAVRRRDFLAAGGYDEAMNGYGWEDLDLVRRLEELGLTALRIDDERYLRYLGHSTLERIRRIPGVEDVVEVYRAWRSRWQEKASLLLHRDGTFQRFGLPDEVPWRAGQWSRRGAHLVLLWSEGGEEVLRRGDEGSFAAVAEDGLRLEPITDPYERTDVLFYFKLEENEALYRNRDPGRACNPGGFGRGTVTENFSGTSRRVE